MAEKPYTSEELKQVLTGLALKGYNAGQSETIEDIALAADPGRLAVALINAIAEAWGENNRRMESYARRVSYGAGSNF